MKALASISAVSSLILVTVASVDTARSETNKTVAASIRSVATSLPRATAEVMQLARAGIDEDVVLSFVGNSSKFHLTADQIVYLTESGVSSRVVQAMLAHDRGDFVLAKQATNDAGIALPHPEANLDPITKQALSQTANAPITPSSKAEVVIPGTKTPAVASVVEPEVEPLRQDLLPIEKVNRPTKKKVLYRVREPYPVELTAPIVFLDAPTF
jgi:hypothetical protein